jgi:hypothetical protein
MTEPEIIEIPIRDGNTVIRIHGIPWDLTEREAEHVAGIIKAYAEPKDECHD